jgi:hypothetical protein
VSEITGRTVHALSGGLTERLAAENVDRKRGARGYFDQLQFDNAGLTKADAWISKNVRDSARNGVTTITVNVTPEMAAMLWARNDSNRPISLPEVARMAKDMMSGKWAHNGEPLIVSETGHLNDGQHRCLACIKSGVPVKTQITFGVSRESRKTVDIGRKRTVGHMLTMSGYASGNHLAHAAATIMVYKSYNRVVITVDKRPTTVETQDWVSLYADRLQNSLAQTRKVSDIFRVSRGLCAALHFIFSEIDENDTDHFFAKFETGTEMGEKDPIYRLRSALLKDLTAVRKLPFEDKAAYIIKAWNAFRQRKSINFLRWIATEPFPKAL